MAQTNQTPAEKLQTILADAKDYGAAVAQEQKLRKAIGSINAQVAAKRTEIAKARMDTHTRTQKLVGVNSLVIGEDDATPEPELGPTIAELEDELRELEDDLERHRAAVPRQEKVVRKLAGPVAQRVAEEFRPVLLLQKERAVEACEALLEAANAMAETYRVLVASGLGAAMVHGQVGPPNRGLLHGWLREAKKDAAR